MHPGPDIVRARQFSLRHGITLAEELGRGKDGRVWRTTARRALKVHAAAPSYQAELAAYMRFRALRVSLIAGFAIPKLKRFDDDLLAIEMTIVTPPFIVDFASAQLDAPPDFIEDEGNTFEDMVRDRFEERADEVMALYHALAGRCGVYLLDLHPHNIKFAPAGGR